MNIGMILDNEFTGDPRVENEVMALQSAGFQVFVLCLSYGEKPLEETFHGAKIIRVKINLWFKKKLVGLNNTIFNFYPLFWKNKIDHFISQNNIERLHVHDLWMLESAFLGNRKHNLPVIADLHENFVHALKHYKYVNTFPGNVLISIEKWKKYESKWLEKVNHIFVVIEEAKQRLIDLNLDPGKISVVSNYVNIKVYSKENENLTNELKTKYTNYQTLVYTGAFDIHRGLDIAIKAVPEIVKKIPNFKLILVGGGIIKEDLQKLTQELSVSEHVDFSGYLPHTDLVSYVKMSNACIIPHLKTNHTDNTIPHKLFQYMIMKKPVIASNCNPIERIVNETSAGLIYENRNPKDCARKILTVLLQDASEMGQKGEEAVLAKYNWENTSRNLTNYYKNS